MKNAEEINKEFMEIKSEDYSSFINFYSENKDYFSSNKLFDDVIGLKKIWMLSEIINSAYKEKEYELINNILQPTLRGFKKYSLLYNYDLKTDSYFKLLIYNIAIDNFNKKKYYKATRYFRNSANLDKQNSQLFDFYKVAKYKLIKNTSRLIGLFGLMLILIKYISILVLDINKTEFILIGYLGAILLVGYGIIEIRLKSPATNTRS
ncbi:hypothetical protein ACE1ET_20495 [Saccharicrinis sp. FJH62]|uniref:hypothetical protein n=1 Tax=Saccharicrinis sp. FJH62 TaxID=3344657 RepID=UPI0035D4450C